MRQIQSTTGYHDLLISYMYFSKDSSVNCYKLRQWKIPVATLNLINRLQWNHCRASMLRLRRCDWKNEIKFNLGKTLLLTLLQSATQRPKIESKKMNKESVTYKLINVWCLSLLYLLPVSAALWGCREGPGRDSETTTRARALWGIYEESLHEGRVCSQYGGSGHVPYYRGMARATSSSWSAWSVTESCILKCISLCYCQTGLLIEYPFFLLWTRVDFIFIIFINNHLILSDININLYTMYWQIFKQAREDEGIHFPTQRI